MITNTHVRRVIGSKSFRANAFASTTTQKSVQRKSQKKMLGSALDEELNVICIQ